MDSEVTILCDNGEVRLSKLLLVSLYNILRNIVKSLGESNKVQLGGMKKEELRVIFKKMYDQVTEFDNAENTIVSQVEDEPEEVIDNNDEVGVDSMLCYITEDHGYYQTPDSPPTEQEDKPIVIPFARKTPVGPLSQRGFLSGCYKDGFLSGGYKDKEKKWIPKTMTCDLCDEMIPFKRGGHPKIDEHMSTVHGYEMNQCHVCRKKLLQINLGSHLMKRHPKCPICGRHIITSKVLEEHIQQHEGTRDYSKNKDEDYTCPHCGKIRNGKRMNEHIKFRCLKNPEIIPETCEICGKISLNRHQHKQHISRKHGEKKKKAVPVESVCSICGKVCPSKRTLGTHILQNHEIRELKHKCEVCDKLFVTPTALKAHMRTHEDKSNCPQCGLKVRKLRLHIMDAHTPDEEKKYQCPDCGKGFLTNTVMEQHRMNVHLKLRPHSCRYGCDISYNDTSNRNQHEKKKHGKLFTTEKEEKLKEKIESLGLDKDLLSAPVV